MLLSKTDIAAPATALRRERLAALNPAVAQGSTAGAVAPDDAVHRRQVPRRALLALPAAPARNPFERAQHTDGIETFMLQRDRALPALALILLLEALAEHCGARLLRMKGLVDIEEMPGQPAVVHGVQHVFAAPEFLDRWPSSDVTTRIVFITQGVPRYFPVRLLDAIEAEVREEMG